MNTNIPNPTHVHEKLATLIKQRFNVFLEVNHSRFSSPVTIDQNADITAITTVAAYQSLEDARSQRNPVGLARAFCSVHDRFERRRGLTIALQRLYRQLANQTR